MSHNPLRPCAPDEPLETARESAPSVFAERSVFSTEYQVFLRHLRDARRQAGLTQVEVGKRLGVAQAIISKCERGERRLDVIELRAYCRALGVSHLDFLAELEKIFDSKESVPS